MSLLNVTDSANLDRHKSRARLHLLGVGDIEGHAAGHAIILSTPTRTEHTVDLIRVTAPIAKAHRAIFGGTPQPLPSPSRSTATRPHQATYSWRDTITAHRAYSGISPCGK